MEKKSASARFYERHPEARHRKLLYDLAYESRPEQLKKRAELARANRKHDKIYGKESREGMDLSHTSHGLVYKPSSVNRGSKDDMPGDRRARGGKKD